MAKLSNKNSNILTGYSTKYRWHLALAILFLLIFRSLSSRWITQQGDAAGYVDAMSDQSNTGDINFTYGFSVDALRDLFSQDPDEFGPDSFMFDRSDKPFFHWHPYLFGYIVRLFPNILQVEAVPLLLLASSYSVGLILLIKQTYHSRISSAQKIAVYFLFLLSPILVESINGQPYFDKLFFGPGIAILLLLFRRMKSHKFRVHKIVVLLILSYTLSERISLMAALMVLGVMTIFSKELALKKLEISILVLTCIIGIVWYILWNQFFSWNPDMQNTSFRNYFPNLRELFFGTRRANFIVFVWNVLPFLCLTLLQFRYFIIGISTLMPNLLVNIGGAELTGYSTHYHSVYLPILLCLSVLAIDTSTSTVKSKKTHTVTTLLALFFSVIGAVSYHGMNSELSISSSIRTQAQKVTDTFGSIPGTKYAQRIAMKSELEELFKGIKEDTRKTISAPESFMPVLTSLGFGSIDYFPVGLGSTELVIVPFTDDTFANVEVSFYGLVAMENREKWSKTILDIIGNSYSLISKKSGYFGNIAIYKYSSS